MTGPTTTKASSTSSTTTGAPGRVGVYADCDTPNPTATIEPISIIVACNGGAVLDGLHWSSWNATSATGTGSWSYQTCDPNCAQGGIDTMPGVQVTLSDPRADTAGGTVFTELRARPWPPTYAASPYAKGAPFPLYDPAH